MSKSYCDTQRVHTSSFLPPTFLTFLFFLTNSAGVGRTGTLIALYTQMQRLCSEQTVDIYTFVKQMRKDRNNMVQTEVSVLEVEFNDFIFTMLLNGVCTL